MFNRTPIVNDYYPFFFIVISRFLLYPLCVWLLGNTGYKFCAQLRKKHKKEMIKRTLALLLSIVMCVSAFVSSDSLSAHVKTSNLSEAVKVFKELPAGLYELDMGYCKGEVYIIDYENNARIQDEIAYISSDVKKYDGIYFAKSPYAYERHYELDILNGIIEYVGGEVALGFDNRMVVVAYRYFHGIIGAYFLGIFTLDLFFRPKLNLVKVSENMVRVKRDNKTGEITYLD